MRMDDPVPQFSHFINHLADAHPRLAYIHLTESRVKNNEDIGERPDESLDFARNIWKKTGRPFLNAGGYNAQNALKFMNEEERENCLVVFGRWFISNVSARRYQLKTESAHSNDCAA